MNDFQQLVVWHLSMDIAEDVYEVTRRFPKSELYGLRVQMRRAAISISSNIAEGAVRRTNPDFRRFLFIAKGSAAELETQLLLAERFGYVDSDEDESLRDNIDKCQRMLMRLIRSLA